MRRTKDRHRVEGGRSVLLVFKVVEIWIIYRLRRRREKKEMTVKTETGRIMKSGSHAGIGDIWVGRLD